jgi:hypothetical protein
MTSARERYVNVLGALGDGTPLFQHPGGRQVRLERLGVETVPHATDVWMRVAR